MNADGMSKDRHILSIATLRKSILVPTQSYYSTSELDESRKTQSK